MSAISARIPSLPFAARRPLRTSEHAGPRVHAGFGGAAYQAAHGTSSGEAARPGSRAGRRASRDLYPLWPGMLRHPPSAWPGGGGASGRRAAPADTPPVEPPSRPGRPPVREPSALGAAPPRWPGARCARPARRGRSLPKPSEAQGLAAAPAGRREIARPGGCPPRSRRRPADVPEGPAALSGSLVRLGHLSEGSPRCAGRGGRRSSRAPASRRVQRVPGASGSGAFQVSPPQREPAGRSGRRFQGRRGPPSGRRIPGAPRERVGAPSQTQLPAVLARPAGVSAVLSRRSAGRRRRRRGPPARRGGGAFPPRRPRQGAGLPGGPELPQRVGPAAVSTRTPRQRVSPAGQCAPRRRRGRQSRQPRPDQGNPSRAAHAVPAAPAWRRAATRPRTRWPGRAAPRRSRPPRRAA